MIDSGIVHCLLCGPTDDDIDFVSIPFNTLHWDNITKENNLTSEEGAFLKIGIKSFEIEAL